MFSAVEAPKGLFPVCPDEYQIQRRAQPIDPGITYPMGRRVLRRVKVSATPGQEQPCSLCTSFSDEIIR